MVNSGKPPHTTPSLVSLWRRIQKSSWVEKVGYTPGSRMMGKGVPSGNLLDRIAIENGHRNSGFTH